MKKIEFYFSVVLVFLALNLKAQLTVTTNGDVDFTRGYYGVRIDQSVIHNNLNHTTFRPKTDLTGFVGSYGNRWQGIYGYTIQCWSFITILTKE